MAIKIKIYFTTYKEEKLLNDTIESFYDNGGEECAEINIINNFGVLKLSKEYPKINILNNLVRPDFSTGHLSRNWNQAIINGFKDLDNPDCDILIHSQNDVIFCKDWLKKLIHIHKEKNIDFFATGNGDCFCSYTVDAIKNIGIWDERFCGIGYQEADYFTRAAFHYHEKVSINDFDHDRIMNPLEISNTKEGFDAYERIGVCYKSNYSAGQTESHKLSGLYGHEPSAQVFKLKFNQQITFSDLHTPRNFALSNMSIYSGLLKNSMLYPYFENKIQNRGHKNYMN